VHVPIGNVIEHIYTYARCIIIYNYVHVYMHTSILFALLLLLCT